MKVLIFILSFMLTFYNNGDCQSTQKTIIEGDVYIYEYAMKKPNQANVEFIIVNNDLIVQYICFTINFSNGKVKNVLRQDNVITNALQYSKRKDGNILIKNTSVPLKLGRIKN